MKTLVSGLDNVTVSRHMDQVTSNAIGLQSQNSLWKTVRRRLSFGLSGYALLLVFLLASFFGTNVRYHAGDNNHIETLPGVYRVLDPHYLDNDYIFTAHNTVNPRSYFSFITGNLAKLTTLETVFYVLTVLSNLWIMITMYAIAYYLSKDRLYSVGAALLILFFDWGNVGGAGFIAEYYLVPQLLATPLVLTAVYLFLKKRYAYSYPFFLLAIAIHLSLSMLTFMAVCISGFILIPQDRRRIVILAIATAMGTIALFPNQTAGVISADDYDLIMGVFRAPHHYLPSTFSQEEYLRFFALTFTGYMGFWYFIRKRNQRTVVLLGAYMVSLLLLLAGYIFVELVHNSFMLQIQTFRLVYLVRVISVIMFMILIGALLGKRSFQTRVLVLILIMSVMAVYNYRLFKTTYVNSAVLPDIRLMKVPNREALYTFIRTTPENTVFLSPPDFGDIRLYGERALVVDWKAFPFNAKDTFMWYDRVLHLYGSNSLDINYRNLGDRGLVMNSRRYESTMAVLYSDTSSDLPVVYKDEYFKVVAIDAVRR